jgi:hypothetical protein
LIGIALHEFGDHFVIAAPNALSAQFRESVKRFRPELHFRPKWGGGSLHEADFLF